MSRHYEKCCDILSDALLNLCRDNEKICHDRNFPFQFESKVDYVVTQRKYVATQVNLCCNIQKYYCNNVFLFQKHRSFATLSRHR